MSQTELIASLQKVIQNQMEIILKQVPPENPFDSEYYQLRNSVYGLLIPDEIFKGAHMERQLKISFRDIWSKLVKIIVTNKFGLCNTNHLVVGTIKQGRLRRIYRVLNQLNYSKAETRRNPNWGAELDYIMAGRGGEIPVSVICDVYAENDQTSERIAFELKASLPNSDQTKVSKEKLLKLYAMTTPQVDAAYFALPYNPYGKKEDYDWSVPNRWFNMKQDDSVLIGDEFWERIGGVGTYQAFLDAVNEISADYKLRIYRDYLGIEPPTNFDKGL